MDFRYFVVNIKNLYGLALVNINTVRYYTKLSNPYLETIDIWSTMRPSMRFLLEKAPNSPKAYISVTTYLEPSLKNYFNVRFRYQHNWLDVWTP